MSLLSRAILLLIVMQSTALVFAAADDAEAVRWFRLAAEQGHADAQYDLGLMYAQGKGVAEDDSQGAHWLRQAAEQGHADAQYRLGSMYEEGEGVTEDAEEAARWYRLAGEQGIALAQYRLGKLIASTDGSSTTQENRSQTTSLLTNSFSQRNTARSENDSSADPLREMLAACAFVKPPTILRGIGASKNEMSDLTVQVRDYVAAMQGSLSCIESVKKELDETASDEQRETIRVVYNNGVDQLTFIADEFNKQVKDYRLRERSVDRLQRDLGTQ